MPVPKDFIPTPINLIMSGAKQFRTRSLKTEYAFFRYKPVAGSYISGKCEERLMEAGAQRRPVSPDCFRVQL